MSREFDSKIKCLLCRYGWVENLKVGTKIGVCNVGMR